MLCAFSLDCVQTLVVEQQCVSWQPLRLAMVDDGE